MRKILLLLVVSAAAIGLLFIPKMIVVAPDTANPVVIQQDKTEKVKTYLDNKQSPLSGDEVSLLVNQKHWKLLIAIMAIESQYGKRQLGYNLFGIGGDSAYRNYNNFSESIIDANNLIEKWQQRGRWLTVDDMNCHYVVPCNENWVHVVKKVLIELENLY